jgi:hypothetical protein
MVWSEVGAKHRALFARVTSAASASRVAPLGLATLNA